MKFILTMNMPSKSGREVHSMIVEHPSPSLKLFLEELEDCDFLIVDEYFVDNNNPGRPPEHRGEVAINYRFVGKVKEYKSR